MRAVDGWGSGQDGSGFGSSVYWPYYIKKEAESNGEWCPCWDEFNPEYLITGYNVENVKFSIACKRKIPLCKNQFPKTEARMVDVFKRMYG